MYPQCIQICRDFIFVEDRQLAYDMQEKIDELLVGAELMDYTIKYYWDQAPYSETNIDYEIQFLGRRNFRIIFTASKAKGLISMNVTSLHNPSLNQEKQEELRMRIWNEFGQHHYSTKEEWFTAFEHAKILI